MDIRRILVLLLITVTVAAAVLLIGKGLSAAAETTVIYDGAGGELMDAGVFGYRAINGSNPFVAAQATAVYSAPGTLLDTTPEINDLAGYSTTFATLERAAGYRLSFTLLVNSETHTSDDRGGVNVILLSDDLRGVEISFWEDEIWVQEGDAALFTHAEGVMFDTASSLVSYDLDVISDTYQLSAAGVPLLRGDLRDYTNWEPPFPGLPDPYETPDFIFFGDNTTSAQGAMLISAAAVTTGTTPVAAPEPAAFSATEDEATAVFTVTLDMPAVLTATVAYQTADLTAVAGEDYLTAAGTLTFPPGSREQSATVTLLNDPTFEGNETLQLRLSNPGYVFVGIDTAVLTIIDDDQRHYPVFVPFLLGNG